MIILIYFLLINPDITCVSLAVWSGVVISTDAIITGTQVVVMCMDGYAFEQWAANQALVVACNGAGDWEPMYPLCAGVYGIHATATATTACNSKFLS